MGYSLPISSSTFDCHFTNRTINPTTNLTSDLQITSQNERVDGILYKTFKSPLFWASSVTTTVAAYSRRALLSLLIQQSYFFPLLGVSMAALGLLGFRQKKLWYEVSLSYIVLLKMMRIEQWYSKILDEVILGAIPLHNHAHENELRTQGIGAVLSLVEDHEAMTSSLFSEPVLQVEWEGQTIDYLRIPIQDLTEPSIDEIKIAVEYISRQAKRQKITYVHCKAGRGRSATVVICYLLKYHSNLIHSFGEETIPVKQAIAFVRSKRPQIYLTASQEALIYKYYAQEGCSEDV